MSAISEQAIDLIFDNFADVIEGGYSYTGDSNRNRYGIPGSYSVDQIVGLDTSIACQAGTTTTAIIVPSSHDYTETRWIPANCPPFFLLCTTAADARNQDAARKITAWNNTTKTFTVSPAFPTTPTTGDVFKLREGFKRIPNGVDLNDVALSGFDRYFHLGALPGKQQPWYGAGLATFETVMTLRLRLLTWGKAHRAEAIGLRILAAIRPILCKGANPDHRDGTYVQALLAEEQQAEVQTKNDQRLILLDRYRLRYRIQTTFK